MDDNIVQHNDNHQQQNDTSSTTLHIDHIINNRLLHTDITQLLHDSTSNLIQCHIVKCHEYSPHYCMNAIDIMDEKMDNMMHINKSTTIQSAINNNQLPSISTLAEHELITMCDTLIQYESMYLYNNENICMTIYTCMYIYDKQHQLPANHWFTLYCNLLLKQLSIQRALIIYAGVYDDDEFVQQIYPSTTFADEYSAMELEQLYEQLDVSQLSSNIQCRLQYRYNQLIIYNNIYKLQMQVEMNDNMLYVDDIHADLHENISSAIKQLQLIQSTLSTSHALIGFDSSIALHELINLPHKILILPSRNDAINNFTNDMKQLLYILNKFMDPSMISFESLLHTLHTFNTLSPHPSLVIRSSVYMLLGTDQYILHKQISLPQLLAQSITEFCCNAIPLNRNTDAPIYHDFNNILYRISQPAMVMLRIQCDNYSRQHRSIDTQITDFAILEDDTSQYDHALKLDNQSYLTALGHNPSIDYTAHHSPYQYPLFSWTVYYALYTCIQQLLIGLRLQLYNSNELSVVYWYADILITTQLQCKLNSYRQPTNQKKLQQLRSGKVKGKKLKSTDIYIYNTQLSSMPPHMLYREIQRTLSRGIAQSCIVLDKLGVIVPSMLDKPHCNEWYFNRFDTFSKLPQPLAPTLQSYRTQVQQLQSNNNNQSIIDLVNQTYTHCREMINKLIQQITNQWEPHEIQSIKSLTKLCIVNSVTIVTAQKTIDKAFHNKHIVRLVFKFDTHDQFATLHLETVDRS